MLFVVRSRTEIGADPCSCSYWRSGSQPSEPRRAELWARHKRRPDIGRDAASLRTAR
jgi:hypothetical protein